MREAIDPIEERIVGAVQRELTRFGTEIVDRFAELQQHAAAEAAARSALESQVVELTARLTAVEADLGGAVGTVSARLEHLDEHTQSRLAAMTETAQRQGSDTAAAAAVAARLDDRLSTFEIESHAVALDVVSMVERADAAANGLTERVARFDEDRVAMDARLDRLDRRRNEAIERLDSVETRLGGIDEIVAEATVGLADRVNGLVAGHETTSVELAAIRAELAETDAEAIEELKERVSSALGQAELVRIEMDRFQETVKHDLDANVSRLTAIEIAVQDQRMDVETAVQLERLEEVERMVLMLDPAQGGRRAYDPAQGGRRAHDSSPERHDEDSESADTGFDAVIRAAEAARASTTGDPRLAPSSGF